MDVKIKRLLIPVSSIIIALVLAVMCILAIVHKNNVEYENVRATIVSINEEYDHVAEQYDYNVYVDYEVDGVKYNGVEYGAYNSSMKIGDAVKVKYDVNNPGFIQPEGSETVPYIVGAVALAVAAYGIFKLVKTMREE